MLYRLIHDFINDRRASISLVTMGLMPIFMIMMVTAYDFGRYFMLSRVMSSATQQTADWIKAKDTVNTPVISNNEAKAYFDNLMQRHIIKSGPVAGGITSTDLQFTGDPLRTQLWLTTKGYYNLTVSSLLPVPPLPIYTKILAQVNTPPLFITIVFNAGEMQSEGEHAYGPGYDNQFTLASGVSWNSNYFKDAVGKTVTPRSTPPHNYYMVAALVKELTATYVGIRKLYINIIPASATINLNPHGYSSSPPGSNETTLPNWIYNSGTYYDYDNTSAVRNTSAICITNRTLPDINTAYPMNSYVNTFNNYSKLPGWSFNYLNLLTTFTHDYYRSNTIYSLLNATPQNTDVYPTNWFSDDELLMDVATNHPIKTSFTASNGNVLAAQKRGYPFHYLDNTTSYRLCPAIDSTPALATFQQVTTPDYPTDTRNFDGTTLSGNQIFWDYMRNYIDPAKQTSFKIWGSPNLAFGLQIAYENIGNVQNTKLVNNNMNANAAGAFDPRSEFQVFVVSDQIGGVKNAGGSAYIEPMLTNTDQTKSRIPFYNKCTNLSAFSYNDTLVNQLCKPTLDAPENATYLSTLQSGAFPTAASFLFSFTHMWWDSAYNPTSNGCFANSLIGTHSCDIVYAATPLIVMKHFYNITNFALDLRYNKNLTKPMTRPKVFFIDTGSGKLLDDCVASNRNPNLPHIIYSINSSSTNMYNQTLNDYNQTWLKPCTAYAAMAGYDTNYNMVWIPFAPDPQVDYHSNMDHSLNYEGGIISMDTIEVQAMSVDYNLAYVASTAIGPNPREYLDKYAPADIAASGFDRIYAYPHTVAKSSTTIFDPYSTDERNINTYANKYLPIVWYDRNLKLQLRSHYMNANFVNYWDTIDYSVDNFANAAQIAAFVVQDTGRVTPVKRPKLTNP